jgi:3-methyladenine DNA glycosylase AlkD
MNPSEFYSDIHQYCVKNANEAIAQKYSRYFKEGYDAYGLDQQKMDAKIKELVARPELELSLVLNTAPLLMETGKYEETSFALLLTFEFRREFSMSTFDHVQSWFDIGIVNWGHADYLATILLYAFLKQQVIGYQDLATWRSSDQKFQRRCVPVSIIKVAKKMDDDYHSMIRFIEPLMLDAERPVQQGVGWFLREIWKLHPTLVENYLLIWKNDAPRLIYQYALEKMPKEERVRFRKEKK